MKLASYVEDRWFEASGGFVEVSSAIDGRVVAEASSEGLDMGAVVRHPRTHGGPTLRRLTFHQRADFLERIAQYLHGGRDELYQISYDPGATVADSRLDIDGGVRTPRSRLGTARRCRI